VPPAFPPSTSKAALQNVIMDVSGSIMEYADFSPATSHSATLAPPSPESENPPTLAADEGMSEGLRSSSAASVQQYAALGQLSYAPATQTTVVTTTTTTTTSFPPLLLKAPRHLYDRDPKQYPLAAASTPDAIKNFSFDIDGKPICFQETDDLDGSLLQVSYIPGLISGTKSGTFRTPLIHSSLVTNLAL